MIDKWLSFFIFAGVCLGCASGPAPERAPEQIREGIYYQNEGADLFTKGCYVRAMDYFQDAHQLYTAVDDQTGVVWALNSIADTYFRLGDMKNALLLYDDAAALSKSEGRSPDLVRALSNKAAVLLALNRPKESASSLDHAETIRNKGSYEALYLKTRALLLIEEKKLKRADAFLDRALDAPGSGGIATRSSIYFSMGHLLLQHGQTEKARKHFEKALVLDRKGACHHDIARDLEAIAATFTVEGNHAHATHFYKRSAKIYALLKDGRRIQAVLPDMKRSATLADIDIRMTLHWIQKWLNGKSGNAICD